MNGIMVRRVALVAAGLVGLGLGSGGVPARAGAIDAVEGMFGASRVHAVTGHGGLTAGVARDGDLVVLSWPNPSYSDQLGHISSNAVDARTMPRFGASEGAGMTLGLVWEDAVGVHHLTWLRDDSTWGWSQSYGAADGANVETVFTSDTLSLTATVTDGVHPSADTMVRHVLVERAAGGGPVKAVWLLTYANLSPVSPGDRLPQLPVVDWALDGRNDYAAVWDGEAGAIVHFHPQDQNLHDAVGSLLVPPAVEYGVVGEALAAGSEVPDLEGAYADGAWLALTTVPAPDQHQVGYDATDLCGDLDALLDNAMALPERIPGFAMPIQPDLLDGVRCSEAEPPHVERGWAHTTKDAWEDASDGELSGSDMAAGEVNEALRTPMPFEGDVAEAWVVLGAGSSQSAALAALSPEGGAQGVLAAADEALSTWLEGLRLPANSSPDVERVARRALINLRVGTVRDNGAIVASINRQPPYGLDWPRDGAFFSVLLYATGQEALAVERADLYDAWQRKGPAEPVFLVDIEPPPDPDTGATDTWPAGAWEMNYYSDGMVGGTWRWEIDNAAFALHAMLSPVAAAGEDEEAREAWLLGRWEAIAAAANLLERWKDPATGLHAPAQEDDNAEYTQTLHGAVTTFGALDLAARAARFVGEEADAERWEARALELQEAILSGLYDEAAGRFVSLPSSTSNPGSKATGPTAWAIWPMTLLPLDDERLAAQVAADLEEITPDVELSTEGGAYFLKNTVSAAFLHPMGETHDQVQALLEAIAAQSTEGTDHFGEVMINSDGGPDQRVATPHLWEGALFALTALALEDPAVLVPWNEALPPSPLTGPFPLPEESSGCGCRLGAEPGADSPIAPSTPPLDPSIPLALLVVVGVAWRAARR